MIQDRNYKWPRLLYTSIENSSDVYLYDTQNLKFFDADGENEDTEKNLQKWLDNWINYDTETIISKELFIFQARQTYRPKALTDVLKLIESANSIPTTESQYNIEERKYFVIVDAKGNDTFSDFKTLQDAQTKVQEIETMEKAKRIAKATGLKPETIIKVLRCL